MDQVDFYAQGPYLSTLRDLRFAFSSEARNCLVKQLIITIQSYYVHLPIKRAAFAIDPIQELELLLDAQAANYTELSFFQQILNIINKLRDRHTTITLPEPWTKIVAYIPIMIEKYYEQGKPIYIISKKLFGYVNDEIVLGTRITHWNGTPIDLYLKDVLATASQGSNDSAAEDLALANLTLRPLAYSVLPKEDWVTISCISQDNDYQTISLPWKFFVEPSGLPKTSFKNSDSANNLLIGLDERMQYINLYNRQFYSLKKPQDQPEKVPILKSLDVYLKYGVINTELGESAYLRFFSFEVGEVTNFIFQIIDILKSFPQDRLIIDLRGNPGGIITAGQSLVQLLTSKPIKTSPVSFRNARGTRAFANLPYFAPWKESLNIMSATGEIYSQDFSLTDLSNLPDYRYPGRVALIVDSLSYSTCDFFAADFKDNEVGPIIGTSARTGGGGANVWTYSLLSQYVKLSGGTPLEPLPNKMSMNISMRRAIRTGDNQGLPIENFGTQADFVHKITYNDLMNNNIDLLKFTLEKLRVYSGASRNT